MICGRACKGNCPTKTSDTTEPSAITGDTAAASREGDGNIARGVPTYILTRDLIRLVQGFYFVFWGLLVAVVAGAQLAIVLAPQRLLEAFLGGGVLATLVGTWRLQQVRLESTSPVEVGARWRGRIRATVWLSASMVYFGGIFLLWRRAPTNLYLSANALAFVGAGIGFIVLLNRAIAAMAAAFDHHELAVESKIYGAGNIAFLLLPFFGVGAFVLTAVITKGASPVDALQFLLVRTTLFPFIIVLLPFSLSLSLVWVAKDATLRRLAAVNRPTFGPTGA